MTSPADLVLDAETLHAMFGSEATYGDIDSPEDGETTFADGTPTAFCTNWAVYVRRALGDRAQLWGFHATDNPTSGIGRDWDGHDFAVVDGRYIVDGWLLDMESYHDTAVMDLEDPGMAGKIAAAYGDRACWERNLEMEQSVDSESPDSRAAYMAGATFFDVLAEAPAPR